MTLNEICLAERQTDIGGTKQDDRHDARIIGPAEDRSTSQRAILLALRFSRDGRVRLASISTSSVEKRDPF